MDILIIGIAGGSGSGKSTITRWIADRFGEKVTIIRHDDYYKAQHDLTYEERTKQNYDCPEAFETALLVEHLKKLKNGESVHCPVYDYTIHDRSDKTTLIEPTPVLLIDGILVLQDKSLLELLDVKLFVDTDADVRILRRLQRDVDERGRSVKSVINQYLDTVKPMHELYVEPSKKNADIIIPEGGHNLVALEMLESKLCRHLGC
mgnify:FL=1